MSREWTDSHITPSTHTRARCNTLCQRSTHDTKENHLFDVLVRMRLISITLTAFANLKIVVLMLDVTAC